MKFIVFKPLYEPAKRMFDDLDYISEVCCYDYMQTNKFWEDLCHAHLFGKWSFLPFKKLWKYFVLINKVQVDEDYVFLYIGSTNTNAAVKSGFIDYMKSKFKKSRHVSFLLDVHAARKLDIEKFKLIFNQIYIFDQIEAQKMKIKYYPLPFSQGPISDITFVGYAKDRLTDLIAIYDKISGEGGNCIFYIIGIPNDKQIQRKGIIYGNPIDSDRALRYIYNTNCVLELKVGDVTSYSDRVSKAIAFNKKILTNNKNVATNPYYNSKMVQIYDTIESIDVSFVTEKLISNQYKYSGEYSPNFLLKTIEKDLSS